MEYGVDYSGCGLWIQWMAMNPPWNEPQGSHQDTVSFIRVTVTALKVKVNICVNFPFPVMPAQTTLVSQMQYKFQSLIKVMHAPKFQSHR